MDERMMLDLFTLPVAFLACFIGGLLLGYVYFSALRQTAMLIVNNGNLLLGLALTFGRLALLVAGFYVAVLGGAFALLAALGGVLCAKAVMLRPWLKAT